MRAHSLSLTHTLPFTQAGMHTQLLTYTHAHTCLHTHMHTSAHASHTHVPTTQTLACMQKSQSLSPHRVLWALLGTGAHAPPAPCARTQVGAPALRELSSGSGNTTRAQRLRVAEGKLCLAIVQPQWPSPPFSSWGDKGGDLPIMKGKTLNANKPRWLVALCWMNPPASVLPRRAQGSWGWERMGGSSSLRGFRLVCSLRRTPLSRSLRFPIFQGAFGLDVLSDPSLLKPEPALLPPPPASCSLKPMSLDPGSTWPCSQLYVHGLNLREQERVPSSRIWTLLQAGRAGGGSERS